MKLHLHLITFVFLFGLIITGGAYTYHFSEGWPLLDSFYFVVVTITTIGYGDLVPSTSVGKLFTMFFSFFGIAMAFYFVGVIGTNLFKKHLNNRISRIESMVRRREEQTKELEDVKKDIVKEAGNKKSKKKKK